VGWRVTLSGVRAVSVGLTLAACQATTDSAAPTIAFDPAEAAFINKQGTVTIEGHAFLHRKNGVVVEAGGEIVRLIPASRYAEDRFRRLYQGRKIATGPLTPHIEAADPRYEAAMRTTKSESNGKFTFEHVGPGRYFVATQFQFSGESRYFQEGGAFYDEVTITGKEQDPVSVVLSGN
jgi:hypothetical protein